MDCFGSALAGSLASVAGKYALDGSQTKYASDAFCRFVVLPGYRAITHSDFHPINSPVRVVNEIVDGTSQFLNKGTTDHSADAVQACSQSSLFMVRASLIGLLLLLNAIMLNFLVKAMQKRGTVSATTIINGFSFVMSGLFGYLFFSELVPLSWWLGIVFILVGVYLVASSKDDQPDIRHHRPVTPMPRHALATRHSSNTSSRSAVSHSSSFDVLSLHGSQDNLLSPQAESSAHVSYDSDDDDELDQHHPTPFVDNVAKKTSVAPLFSPSDRSPPAPLLSADRDEDVASFDSNETAFGSLAPMVGNSKSRSKSPNAECDKVEEAIEYYKNKEQEELLEQDKLDARNERLRKEKQEQTLRRRFSIDTIDQSEVATTKIDAANLLRSKIGDPKKQQAHRRRSKEFSDPVPAASTPNAVKNPHELYQVAEDGDLDLSDS